MKTGHLSIYELVLIATVARVYQQRLRDLFIYFPFILHWIGGVRQASPSGVTPASTLLNNLPLSIKQAPSVDILGLVLRHICSNLLISCNCVNLCVYAIILCYIPWNR